MSFVSWLSKISFFQTFSPFYLHNDSTFEKVAKKENFFKKFPLQFPIPCHLANENDEDAPSD